MSDQGHGSNVGGSPPRIPERLLAAVLRDPRVREDVLGDLHAAYQKYERRSRVPALRYWIAALDVGIRFLLPHGSTQSRVRGSPPHLGGEKESLVVSLLQDLRLALRALRRSRGFTAAALLTLALGIGANTAIFSVVNGVLLKPLPYPEPDRLVFLGIYNAGGDGSPWAISRGMYAVFRRESQTLENFGFAFSTREVPVEGEEPQQLQVARVTASLFETLRVPPLLGRWIAEEDDPNAVAVLSHDLWSNHYGSDRQIVGNTIVVDGRGRTVVGVMPPGFSFPTAETEVWTGYVVSDNTSNFGGFDWPEYSAAVARLRPGVSRTAAEAELNALRLSIPALFPDSRMAENPDNWPVLVWPLSEREVFHIDQTLWIVLGSMGFVLLVACANVANLFLVRAAARHRERAVRTALGASRGRLARHFLAESWLLAGVGGLIGVGLAWTGVRILIRAGPAVLPRLNEVGIDTTVLAFTAGISLLAALVFGAIAAFRPVPNVVSSLRDSSPRTTAGRSGIRGRNVLIVSQVAFALVLLVGAGLMTRSFWQLLQVHPGFEARNVLTFEISVPAGQRYRYSEVAPLHRELLDRIAAIPGVEHAGASTCLPLSGRKDNGCGGTAWAIEEDWPNETSRTGNSTVSPGYFRALGIPVLAGRGLEPADLDEGNPVVLVSASLAEGLFPGEDPLGKRVANILRPGDPYWYRIVGVVGDVKYHSLTDGQPHVPCYADCAMVYGPLPSDLGNARTMRFLLRTATPPLGLVEEVRTAVQSIDPMLAVARVQTMEEIVGDSGAQMAFTMVLLAIAAAMALSLGSIGIYGVLSYVVGQRTSEIGIRMALGARAAEVSRMVVRQGGTVVLIGLAIGLIGAFALTRVMEAILFNVSPTDPATYVVVTVFLLAIGLMATYLPARRAAEVDPVEALRAD